MISYGASWSCKWFGALCTQVYELETLISKQMECHRYMLKPMLFITWCIRIGKTFSGSAGTIESNIHRCVLCNIFFRLSVYIVRLRSYLREIMPKESIIKHRKAGRVKSIVDRVISRSVIAFILARPLCTAVEFHQWMHPTYVNSPRLNIISFHIILLVYET